MISHAFVAGVGVSIARPRRFAVALISCGRSYIDLKRLPLWTDSPDTGEVARSARGGTLPPLGVEEGSP